MGTELFCHDCQCLFVIIEVGQSDRSNKLKKDGKKLNMELCITISIFTDNIIFEKNLSCKIIFVPEVQAFGIAALYPNT